jgi:hypothetical protein
VTTSEETRRWRWEQLRDSLQALAQPAKTQLARFPDFVVKADELALDFNIFYEACLPEMTEQQIQVTKAIDDRLDEMSGPTGPWSDDDLKHAEEWVEIRQLAKRAPDVFGWPDEAPPPTTDVFVHFPKRDADNPDEPSS